MCVSLCSFVCLFVVCVCLVQVVITIAMPFLVFYLAEPALTFTPYLLYSQTVHILCTPSNVSSQWVSVCGISCTFTLQRRPFYSHRIFCIHRRFIYYSRRPICLHSECLFVGFLVKVVITIAMPFLVFYLAETAFTFTPYLLYSQTVYILFTPSVLSSHLCR